MKQLFWIALFAFTLWLPRSETAVAQPSDASVVRAVLFMSPTCGHCHYVITEVLQPMAEAYGNQLEILTIDVSQPGGSQLYNQAVRTYEIPEDRRGVSTLIVGNVILVGSGEIPAQFPELVVSGLAAGGSAVAGFSWPIGRSGRNGKSNTSGYHRSGRTNSGGDLKFACAIERDG